MDAIIEKAVELAAKMVQQRASYEFQIISDIEEGKVRWNAEWMTSVERGGEGRDDGNGGAGAARGEAVRVPVLMVAPGLVKGGTSEGTNFEGKVLLMKAEVETRVVGARHGNGGGRNVVV